MTTPASRRSAHSGAGAVKAVVLGVVLAMAPPASSSHALESASEARRASSLPANASQDWWSGVTKGIAASEYQVTWSERTVLADVPEALQAPNRAQGFRTYFTKQGIRVVPRTEEHPSWEWGLAVQGYGWAGDVRAVAATRPRASENRVDYDRPGFSEWYVNSPRGLEQGFTLDPPLETSELADTSYVAVEMVLTGQLGAYPSEDGQRIDFRHGSAVVLRYAELVAADAASRPLPARMEVDSASPGSVVVRLVVSVSDAVWPVTIDPLATSPNWTAESDQDGAWFGFSVASAGDVNGDGYADVIVGAYKFDKGTADEGRVYVFHGSPAGLSASADWTAENGQAYANFGYSVASAGDVNGDGYADVIAGAPYYDDDETNEGRVFVFHGSTAGLSAAPTWTAESNQPVALFGSSVASAGDVNGDGYADVIVGANLYDYSKTDDGAAFVFHGSASGLQATAAWTRGGDQVSADFGSSVASAGDVNGDGYADVIVGAHYYDKGQADEGAAFVYHGSASGLSTTAAWIGESDQAGAYFAHAVASAGDVNGDGYADVIVGMRNYSNGQANEGRAAVYCGSATGLSTPASWTAESDQADAIFGSSVASAGDVNGDGYADVIVGAQLYDNGQTNEGAAFVYYGSAGGLAAAAAWTAESDQASAYFGSSVASAGDVNGDGYADILIGAHAFDSGQSNEGRAFAYYGSAAGIMAAPSWALESDQSAANLGFAVASAGDVNGDGYADVIVGAPYYDNGQTDEGAAFVYHGSASGLATTAAWTGEGNQAYGDFGSAVASADDVNGDGYADVVVGAPTFDNGEEDEGRAFVYHGSAAGLSATAAWIAESNQANARFSKAVASAGDVNGDGYADVIVGAQTYDNGETDEGAAFVYYGSASGLATTAAWTGEGDQTNAEFASSVASAGDVNGDGYADVIVGAAHYDNGETDEGRAFVFHGSTAGLSATAAWTAEPNQASAWFGRWVASAGDVNGDGYADVIVGAPTADNGQTNEGQAFVYHGSAMGLSAIPAWSTESDQTNAWFGFCVASPGDVNGDGYADVIVGAPMLDNGEVDEGRAFVYLGSAAGLSGTAAWTAESNQVQGYTGYSVSSAGDVNGDGFADVIVGAAGYDNGQTDEGAAFVYLGNGGSGRPVLAQQLKGGGSSTLQQAWGSAGETDEFQVRARHSSPFGRERVKVEVEGCPPGVPFGHASCVRTTSAEWTDSTASAAGVSLTGTLSGLASGTLYRWRERTLWAPYSVTQSGITPPPNPAHGPWRRLGAQAVEADIRTAFPPTHVLTVSKDGTGTGTVTSEPAGVNCGGTCSYDFVAGTDVELTAVADAGSKFTGWSGEGCSGTGTCSVTMNAPRSVSAIFTSCTVVISDQTYDEDKEVVSCGTLAFGPTVLVTGTGNLTARAATQVSLRNGFEVATGGRFTAGIDAGLAP